MHVTTFPGCCYNLPRTDAAHLTSDSTHMWHPKQIIMIRIYALGTTRHIGTIKVSNEQSTEEQYLN